MGFEMVQNCSIICYICLYSGKYTLSLQMMVPELLDGLQGSVVFRTALYTLRGPGTDNILSFILSYACRQLENGTIFIMFKNLSRLF